MVSDIAEGTGSEDGVGQGMERHIGIAVAQQPLFVGDADAAEYQGSPGSEAVYVESVAYAVHNAVVCRVIICGRRGS